MYIFDTTNTVTVINDAKGGVLSIKGKKAYECKFSKGY